MREASRPESSSGFSVDLVSRFERSFDFDLFGCGTEVPGAGVGVREVSRSSESLSGFPLAFASPFERLFAFDLFGSGAEPGTAAPLLLPPARLDVPEALEPESDTFGFDWLGVRDRRELRLRGLVGLSQVASTAAASGVGVILTSSVGAVLQSVAGGSGFGS